MTELVSMLVPLQGTLPGWPTVPQPTVLEVLGLLFGIPLIIIIVISLLAHGPDLIRAGRGENSAVVAEPLWLGAAPADRAAVTAGAQSSSLPSSQPATEAAPVPSRAVPAPEPIVGGASVRW